ncbi:unnamed protein product, partial [Strongylus vulgaris]
MRKLARDEEERKRRKMELGLKRPGGTVNERERMTRVAPPYPFKAEVRRLPTGEMYAVREWVYSYAEKEPKIVRPHIPVAAVHSVVLKTQKSKFMKETEEQKRKRKPEEPSQTHVMEELGKSETRLRDAETFGPLKLLPRIAKEQREKKRELRESKTEAPTLISLTALSPQVLEKKEQKEHRRPTKEVQSSVSRISTYPKILEETEEQPKNEQKQHRPKALVTKPKVMEKEELKKLAIDGPKTKPEPFILPTDIESTEKKPEKQAPEQPSTETLLLATPAPLMSKGIQEVRNKNEIKQTSAQAQPVVPVAVLPPMAMKEEAKKVDVKRAATDVLQVVPAVVLPPEVGEEAKPMSVEPKRPVEAKTVVPSSTESGSAEGERTKEPEPGLLNEVPLVVPVTLPSKVAKKIKPKELGLEKPSTGFSLVVPSSAGPGSAEGKPKKFETEPSTTEGPFVILPMIPPVVEEIKQKKIEPKKPNIEAPPKDLPPNAEETKPKKLELKPRFEPSTVVPPKQPKIVQETKPKKRDSKKPSTKDSLAFPKAAGVASVGEGRPMKLESVQPAVVLPTILPPVIEEIKRKNVEPGEPITEATAAAASNASAEEAEPKKLERERPSKAALTAVLPSDLQPKVVAETKPKELVPEKPSTKVLVVPPTLLPVPEVKSKQVEPKKLSTAPALSSDLQPKVVEEIRLRLEPKKLVTEVSAVPTTVLLPVEKIKPTKVEPKKLSNEATAVVLPSNAQPKVDEEIKLKKIEPEKPSSKVPVVPPTMLPVPETKSKVEPKKLSTEAPGLSIDLQPKVVKEIKPKGRVTEKLTEVPIVPATVLSPVPEKTKPKKVEPKKPSTEALAVVLPSDLQKVVEEIKLRFEPKKPGIEVSAVSSTVLSPVPEKTKPKKVEPSVEAPAAVLPRPKVVEEIKPRKFEPEKPSEVPIIPPTVLSPVPEKTKPKKVEPKKLGTEAPALSSDLQPKVEETKLRFEPKKPGTEVSAVPPTVLPSVPEETKPKKVGPSVEAPTVVLTSVLRPK